VAAGIVFSLLSSIVINIGNVVQKQAVTGLPEFSAKRSTHLIRVLLTSRSWVGGFMLCLVGLGFQVMAFALAPIPVVQSIFNAGIVLLLIFSRVRLKERLGRTEWVGLAVVVISLIAISATLSTTENSAGTSGSGVRALIAAAPTFVVVIGIVALIRKEKGASGFLYGFAAGLLYGAAALGTKGASTLVVSHGVVGSIPYVFASVYPYLFLVFSVFGMMIYQMGLQRFRIAVVGSMSDVVCSTYLVAVGMVVFGESLPKDPVTLTLRLAGFVGVLVGSVLVALAGGSDRSSGVTMADSDIGLGPVLLAEVEAHSHLNPDAVAASSKRQS
jgi:multidrug transporter EmrE-like cation transporter